MNALIKLWSDWCGNVDDLAPWSSPAIARTPPCLDEPAALACLKTSIVLSIPGPFPYQIPKTPSFSPLPLNSPCCDPQTAVAPNSSFKPG